MPLAAETASGAGRSHLPEVQGDHHPVSAAGVGSNTGIGAIADAGAAGHTEASHPPSDAEAEKVTQSRSEQGEFMSHIVTQKADINDFDGVVRACKRLGLEKPIKNAYQDYGGVRAAGWEIDLSPIDSLWLKPVIIKGDGSLAYDNYGERWGLDATIDKFKQAYAIEMAKGQAAIQGYRVLETAQEDGSVLLDVYCE